MEPATAAFLLAISAPMVPTKLGAMSYSDGGAAPIRSDRSFTSIGSSPTQTAAQIIVSVGSVSASTYDEALRQLDRLGCRASADAKRFLCELPAGFPIPKVARSEDGLVTLFWEIESFYADIEFTGDGFMSVFTRSRQAKNIDKGKDGISVTTFDEWGYEYLGALAPALQRAA